MNSKPFGSVYYRGSIERAAEASNLAWMLISTRDRSYGAHRCHMTSPSAASSDPYTSHPMAANVPTKP